jgi:heme exporter protein D
MYFESFSQAISMDGHGAYVWSAFAITVLMFSVIALHPVLRKKRLLREIAGEARRNTSTGTS